MYYLYHSHLGDGYITTESLPEEELVCKLCNKKDTFVGSANDISGLAEILNAAKLQYSIPIKTELDSIIGDSDSNLHIVNNGGIILLMNKDRDI